MELQWSHFLLISVRTLLNTTNLPQIQAGEQNSRIDRKAHEFLADCVEGFFAVYCIDCFVGEVLAEGCGPEKEENERIEHCWVGRWN